MLVQVDRCRGLPRLGSGLLLDVWHAFASDVLLSLQRGTLRLTLRVANPQASSLIVCRIALLPPRLGQRGLIRRGDARCTALLVGQSAVLLLVRLQRVPSLFDLARIASLLTPHQSVVKLRIQGLILEHRVFAVSLLLWRPLAEEDALGPTLILERSACGVLTPQALEDVLPRLLRLLLRASCGRL